MNGEVHLGTRETSGVTEYRWEIRDGETVAEHGHWRPTQIRAIREGATERSRAISRSDVAESLFDTVTSGGRPVVDLPSV